MIAVHFLLTLGCFVGTLLYSSSSSSSSYYYYHYCYFIYTLFFTYKKNCCADVTILSYAYIVFLKRTTSIGVTYQNKFNMCYGFFYHFLLIFFS